MFARLSTSLVYVFLLATVLVAATPWNVPPPPPTTPTVTVTVTPAPTGTPVTRCNTGPIQCCNTVEKASSSGVGVILGLLGIVINDLTTLVGLDCTSIIGANTCSAQTVCCQNNNFKGLIAIGCVPINISL